MAAWHRTWRADVGLRVAGLLICVLAYAAVSRLQAMYLAHASATSLAVTLAAIGFLGAGAGSVLMLLGRHVFDEVEIGRRWQPQAREIFPARATATLRDDGSHPETHSAADRPRIAGRTKDQT